MPNMENSIVTRQFNKAFGFVEAVAKQSSSEDDVVDANLRNTLLQLMQVQRQHVQRAWLFSHAAANSDLDLVNANAAASKDNTTANPNPEAEEEESF